MTGTGTEETELSGVMRLSWVTDHLEHVLHHSRTDEPAGTWTGLACPSLGLEIGTDVDNAMLKCLAHGDICDLTWEAPVEFTTQHAQPSCAALQAHQSANAEAGEQYWQQAQTLWSRAWSANYQALALMQNAGLTRFSPLKPQRWVIASFEHHCSPHGIAHPHIHNIVIPALTTASPSRAIHLG